jgi:hypothetical protein
MLATLVAFLIGVCSRWFTETDTRTGVPTSLVDHLYPRGEVPPPPAETIPELELPIRVDLDAEFDRLQTRVKDEQVAVVTYKPGHEKSGGGATDPVSMVFLALVLPAAGFRFPRT